MLRINFYINLGTIFRLPNLLVILLTQYTVRMFLIKDGIDFDNYSKEFHFFLFVMMTSIMGGAGYIINDYYDIKVDAINNQNNIIVGKKVSRRKALAWGVILNAIAMAIAIYLGQGIAFAVLGAIFILWLYSNFLKRLVFWGNFTVAFLVSGVILLMAFFYKTTTPLVYVFAVFSFFIALIRSIIRDMEDVRGDMHFGIKTFPIIWGFRKTKILLYLILTIFIILTFLFAEYLQLVVIQRFLLLMLFPALLFIYKLYWADTKRNYTFLVKFCNTIMLSGILLILFL